MTKDQIEIQIMRIEGFKEGYLAALMWVRSQLPPEPVIETSQPKA